MGAWVPLGPSAQLLRITAEQLEAMATRGALAGLPRIELRDGVLCQFASVAARDAGGFEGSGLQVADPWAG